MMTISNKILFHIDHVIWQPTSTCSNNCKNCYMKEYRHYQDSSIDTSILGCIFGKRTVSCGQFTISLNSYNKKIDPRLLRVLDHVGEMFQKEDSQVSYPQLWITAHSIEDILNYKEQLDNSTRFFRSVKTISISKIPTPGELLKLRTSIPGPDVFCNLLVRADSDISKIKNKISLIEKNLKGIYLIIEKTPLGSSLEITQEDLTRIDKWFQLSEELPKRKLIQDSCIIESYDVITGKCKGCSAGISKIHLWPDGTVTGCPYDSWMSGAHYRKEVLEESIEGIIDRRNNLSISLCRLPYILKAYGKMTNERK